MVCLCSSSHCSEKGSDAHNLGFAWSGSFDDFVWNVHLMQCEFQQDSTLSVNGKFPLKLSQRPDYIMPKIKPQLLFSALQFFRLGDGYDNVSVTINCRSENLDSFWLKGVAVDEYDNVVSQDSTELSRDGWRTDTLDLFCKDAKYLILKLAAEGVEPFSPQATKDQFVWLDRVELSADGGRDVEFAPIPKGKIPRNSTTELEDAVQDTPIPFDKKIVALGETMHGNRTIAQTQFGLIKRMVEEGNCKLIIWEYPMPDALYWDLYINGTIPEERMYMMDEFALDFDSGIFRGFIDWLREYNLSHSRKVKIVGNLNTNNISDCPLFYYLDVFYDEHSSDVLLPLMERVARGRDFDAVEYVEENEQAMREILGDDNYRDFLYVYSQSKMSPTTDGVEWLNLRDYYMARISENYIDTYLADDESAVMIAHAEHVSKKYAPSLWHSHSMGQYLNERYGDDYYPVAITVGRGELLNHKVGDSTRLQRYTLPLPVKSSLEDVCLTKYDGNMWIETSRLSEPVFAYRTIGNGFVSSSETTTGNLKERFDGVLFIEESTLPEEYERTEPDFLESPSMVKFTKLGQYRKEKERADTSE